MALMNKIVIFAGLCLFSCSFAAESDECSLLQTAEGSTLYKQAKAHRGDSEETAPGSGRCLKFMHIPKTGGTSIDAWGMAKKDPAFNSMMRETYSRIATGMDQVQFRDLYNSSLGALYSDSHRNFPHYKKFLFEHIAYYKFLPQQDSLMCEDLHSPPIHSQHVQNWYIKDHCDVFCAVRNPYKKFLSAYQMNSIGACDPAGFEAKLHKFLPALKMFPSTSMCMFVPQVNYVYGAPSKSSWEARHYCNKIIHTEHLDTEFSALMESLGRPSEPKLPWAFSGKEMEGKCKIDESKVTQAAKDLIYEHYKADFEAFGYPRP